MSKLKVTTIANVADSESTDVTNVINGSAKAWVNFNGGFGTSPFTVANGGIRAAFNVSSVTDNGTGDYTVNFTNSMPDANYAVKGNAAVGSLSSSINFLDFYVPAASSIRFQARYHNGSAETGGGTAYDYPYIFVAIFR